MEGNHTDIDMRTLVEGMGRCTEAAMTLLDMPLEGSIAQAGTI